MPRIHLVTEHSIQTDILAKYIHSESGIFCTIQPSLERVLLDDFNGHRALIMFDCSLLPPMELWNFITNLNGTAKNYYFALFNVSEQDALEFMAVDHGAHGLFYTSDNIDLIMSGIKAMFREELWFPRWVLSKYLVESRVAKTIPQGKALDLTSREEEILRMVALGESNSAISEHLCISTSTVKSHLYNIYNKINVKNRTKAALWALQNMDLTRLN